MTYGQIDLHYNYELDELFLIKRGVVFGKYMMETFEGTSLPYKKFSDLETTTSIIEHSIFIQEL